METRSNHPRAQSIRVCWAVLLGLAVLLVLARPAPAFTAHKDISYDIDSPAPAPANLLDLYTPNSSSKGDDRPVVVYVHGGGWRRGDKANQIDDKVKLFTGSGYVFASLNYRLSPVGGDYEHPDPNRIKFPDQPHDVGEAIGWLDRHVSKYGGDPTRMILIGHSAGAQIVSLVSTDPSYIKAYGVKPWQIIGTVPLDSAAFDITQAATKTDDNAYRDLIWNAFGTPAENASSGSWLQASATRWASAKDPDFLLITGEAPGRIAINQEMAEALGQDPADVLSLPYDHGEISAMLGSPKDTADETDAVSGFISRMIHAAKDPKVKLHQHPGKKVHTKHRKTKVRFTFSSKTHGAKFECRLDGGKFKHCKSPQKYKVKKGQHKFRVHAVSDRGRPGPNKLYRFRVLRR